MFTKDNVIFNSIILECKSLIAKLNVPNPRHIWKKQNRVADNLAKEESVGLSSSGLQVLQVLILCALEAFEADSVGNTFVSKTKNYNNYSQGKT